MQVDSPFHLKKFEKIEFYLLLFLEQCFAKTKFFSSIEKKKKKLFLTIDLKFRNLPDAKVKSVDSLLNLSSNDFKKTYFNKSQPVVFKGAAKSWPCCKKWNLDYFKDFIGKKDVLLVDVDGLTAHKAEKKFEVLSVAELVANISSGGDKYLRFSPLLQQHPNLAEDLDFNWLNNLKSRWSIGNTYYLFMGGKKTVTHLHCDQPCNLFVQIYGQKKWTLFAADQSYFLYPQATQTAYFKSSANLDKPDYEKYPLLKKASRWEVILEPGDVLYIPPHVWHYVENQTDTIATGFRFSSLLAASRSSFIFTLLRFCAQNPPIWKTRKYGKIDTNLIWADSNGNVSDVLSTIKKRNEKE